MNVVFNTNEQFNVSFEHTDTFIIDLCEYQTDISFVTDDDFQVSFDEGETFNCQFDMGSGGGGRSADEYHGSYEVTPSLQTQTLNTADRILTRNVIINPIPNNYGLITWNGSSLTVS